ncbi:MAG: agmatine deiminase family protein [Bacteroidales bacterium]|nr:agmatine deiminase family protein [Bacteroidales bacterium]
MKKVVLFLAATAITLGVAAQSQQPTEQMLREFRQTVQKRDISKKHLETNIPLSTKAPVAAKGAKSLPEDRVWFPGEWEEVKAIVVTAYYNYSPATSQGTGYWIADPLVTGWADYYKYSNSGWQHQGTGPYKATMDTSTSFGKVFFYLMDGIQLGGAEAWVRVEQMADTAKVIRTLTRMGLRHDNVKFLIGPGNSFWYRDCGPICFYYGNQDSVAMLDFTYYPGRALDDSLPSIIHWQKGIANYITKVEWEGGNCLVDGAGMVVSSDAIYSNNNDGYGQLVWDGQNINSLTYSQDLHLSQSQVRQALHDLLGQRATYVIPAYRYDGGTGHIDLYADMYDENGFVFSVMPNVYSSWVDYQTGAQNMENLCSYHSLFDRDYYTMATLPFPSTDNGGNFSSQSQYDNNYTRTYSNHTFVNNVILQPCFSEVGTDGKPTAAWDRANIEAIQAAYPGYTIYCVDVREFDGSGGAIHCVTKQIPADNPVRILHKNLHGTFALGEMTEIPVSAIITNKSGIAHAEVVYRIDGGEWQTASLASNGNRFNGSMMRSVAAIPQHSYEYYISATSNNGKTITKPMTASQGGYYTFTYTDEGVVDSTMFDYDTTAMDMEDITFTFGSNWANEDMTEQNPHHLDIESVSEHRFGQFYPNPAAEQANMIIDLGEGGNYTVTILDLNGRTLHTTSLQAAGQVLYTVNTAKLASGLYTVLFSNGSERVARKLIVNH